MLWFSLRLCRSGRLASIAGLLAVLGLAPHADAQQSAPVATLRSLFTFYADNTEFFTPYRLGETLLGTQFTTALSLRAQNNIEVLAGVFGEFKYGSTHFLDKLEPVLSLRWRAAESPTRSAMGVLGALVTTRRHGFLEPLQETTFELTRPLEYGGQWIEHGRWLSADGFLNWQRLVGPEVREAFDAGGTAAVHPVRWLSLDGQLHWVHRGGQVYEGSLPVTNSLTSAVGVRLKIPGSEHQVADPVDADESTKPLAELAAFHVSGNGNIDPQAPSEQPTGGAGTYYRAAVRLGQRTDVFGIHWRGRGFLSAEGDRNYSSEGITYSRFYRLQRTYIEAGAARHVPLSSGIGLDAEFRLHRVDHERSTDALIGSTWEYSYRVVARVPIDIRLKSR
jgi:hypothetical protein